MKIAFFHHVPVGGARRVIYEQIHYLSQQHTIDLYTIDSSEKDFLDFSQLDCAIYMYQNPYKDSSFRLLNDYRKYYTDKYFHKKIADDINRKKYDAVIVHPDRRTQAPFILRYLKSASIYFCEELLRIGYESDISPINHLAFPNKVYEQIIRTLAKNIDKQNALSAQKIVTTSHYMQHQISQAYGVSSLRCPLGVDIKTFFPQKIQRKNQILFVAHPANTTGYTILIQSLDHLPKKIRPTIKVIDFSQPQSISDRQLSTFYSESLATVALSYHEPFGLTVLESLACQTPVIALNEGGYIDTIGNNVDGFLIPRDPKILAEKIYYLYQHPAIRDDMGRKGRKKVEKSWTWQQHGKKLEKIV